VALDSGAFAISAFISILAITNPLSTIGVFLSLTKGQNDSKKDRVAFLTCVVALVVLMAFAISGFFIFQIYSITLEAFRIAGGLVLFTIGMKMLFPQEGKAGSLPAGGEAYVVPLAIPMTSGPGAITTTVVLASQAVTLWHEFALWGAIFAACLVNFVVLKYSEIINHRLGQEGISALGKIMGLIVCAIAVQFVITGLRAAFPILG